MHFVAGHAQRFKVVEVVGARQLGMLAGARHDVVDFEPSDTFRRAPIAHRRQVTAMRRVLRPRRALGAVRSAPSATVAIAAFHRAPRDRPPVVRPEQLAASIAAPRPASRRQHVAAPRASTGSHRWRQRTYRKQRILLRHGIRGGTVNDATRSLLNVTLYWSMSASSYSHTLWASSDAREKYPCG